MKVMQGHIVSLKNEQTAHVLVERRYQHPLYGKFFKRSQKFACHYEGMELTEGDLVEISPTRPVSKTKRFKVVGKVEIK